MSDDMRGAALAYARMGWKVFPLHTIAGGACSCGRACGSPGKHPRTRAGFKDATADQQKIEAWWKRWPDANIGIATGDGLVVIDVDGPEGAAEFSALTAANEPLPPTLVAQTGNGFHLVFRERPGASEVRSSARDHVHVRGAGGYIVAAPSRHHSGRNYRWIKQAPIAELPDWLRSWSQGYETNKKTPADEFKNLGMMPDYLKQQTNRNITALSNEALKTVWSIAEQTRIVSALASIPANSHDSWVAVGMSLKDLDWQRSDGTEIGFELWVTWSETCPEKFSLTVCEARWNSFKRTGRTVGTIFHLARQHGWNGGAPAPLGSPVSEPTTPGPQPGMNGHDSGPQALPAAFLAPPTSIHFPDTTDEGFPKATCTNAGVAVTALGIVCAKDLFHERMLVGGHAINAWAGEMSDDAVQMIRKVIRYRFGFDPNDKNVRDACTQLCLEHQFDPITDYLDGLTWDGIPRLDNWLARYMGAADTELNRVIGRLVLVAAVRRARRPGTKFDEIVVFESKEGRGKSTAIEILAGKENFSDQSILGRPEKEQQEAMCGIWLYEIADLTGMKKAEIEHVKSFASRKVDRARPAYGRFRVDRPRRTVFFATTNDDEYLKSQTGNRRFWPISVGQIDLDALRRDRDQLWAEAAMLEARGVGTGLPERLWTVAAEEQNQRLESDEWAAPIHNYLNLKSKPQDDVSVMEVLTDNQFLQLQPGQVGRGEQMRAGVILRRMGFLKYRKRLGGNAMEWRYRRPI